MPLAVLARVLTFVLAVVLGLVAYFQLWERGEAEIRAGKRPAPQTSTGQLLMGARAPGGVLWAVLLLLCQAALLVVMVQAIDRLL